MCIYILLFVMTSFFATTQSKTGIRSTLNFEIDKQRPLLKDDERLTLNCSGELHKDKLYAHNESYYFRLSLTNDNKEILRQSTVVSNNDFELSTFQWILFEIKHEYYISTRKYNCRWSTNFTGFTNNLMSKTIVFANPPEAPVNISHLYFKNDLFIFADSPYGKFAQDELGTKYSLRYRGDRCTTPSRAYWRASKPCQVKYEKNSLVTCTFNTKMYNKCKDLLVTVVLENHKSLGKSRSQLFQISKENENQPITLREKSYKGYDKIVVELSDISTLTSFFDVRYKVKFWPSDKDENSFQEIASISSVITISNLIPSQCYNMEARIKVKLSPQGRMMTKLSNRKRFCTADQEISSIPQNLTCEEVPKINPDDVSTIQLKWNYPVSRHAVQETISFRLLMEVDGESQTVNESSIPFQNRTNHVVYSETRFKPNTVVRFSLKTCSEDGCSENSTSCELFYKDLLEGDGMSDFDLDLFLSCIIPTIVILFLVLGAFWSYYSRKELLAKFDHLESQVKTDLDTSRSVFEGDTHRTPSPSPTGTITTQLSFEQTTPTLGKR